MTGPAPESQSRTPESRRPSGQPRRRSCGGCADTLPAVRPANTRYAGRQGLSAHTYLPRVDLEGSFRRVRFALACRTEPLVIILRQNPIVVSVFFSAAGPLPRRQLRE